MSKSTVTATFNHSYDRTILPAPFILGSTITENQLAGGFFHTASTGNSGANGTSENTFTYTDTAGNTYDREVSAASNVIVSDHQGGSLAPLGPNVQQTTDNVANIGMVRRPGHLAQNGGA